jgi:hypothetical protein
VIISAFLDASTTGGKGPAIARWFNAALSGPLVDLRRMEEQGIEVVSMASTRKDEASRPQEFAPISKNWPLMERVLMEAPETAHLLFFDDDHDGPVSHLKSSSIMVREPNMDLSLILEPDASELEDAVYCSGIIDFLVSGLDPVNPAFARVDVTGPWTEDTNLDVALGRSTRRSVDGARSLLRGYSWATVCPAELCERLGGASKIRASEAFCKVIPLAAGGMVLQATSTIAEFSDDAMRKVFRVLAPVLPPGMPKFDPAYPKTRFVPEDASTLD